MALTVTALITAQVFGDGTPLAPSILTLQAATNLVALSVQFNSVSAERTGGQFMLSWYTAPFVVTAAVGKASAFKPNQLVITIPRTPGAIIAQTDPVLVQGGTLYAWLDEPLLQGTTTTISLSAVEIS